jgi:hypothetical protein
MVELANNGERDKETKIRKTGSESEINNITQTETQQRVNAEGGITERMTCLGFCGSFLTKRFLANSLLGMKERVS